MRQMNILWVTALVAATQCAYAEETPKTQRAAEQPPQVVVPQNRMLPKRARLVQIGSWLSEGILGESKEGLLVLRGKSRSSIERAMKEENEDREKDFKALSVKTGTPIAAQRKLYAKKRQQESPRGTPLQGADGLWVIKT